MTLDMVMRGYICNPSTSLGVLTLDLLLLIETLARTLALQLKVEDQLTIDNKNITAFQKK